VIVNLDTANRQEKAAGEYHTWQFTYDEANDCCICPRGNKLAYERTQKARTGRYWVWKYRCKSSRDCPVRWQCSRERYGRAVRINPYLGAILRQRQKQQDRAKANLLKRRIVIAEPAFARIKHLLEFRRWTMGSLEKVKAQWFFVCALANLNRMYTLWKAGALRLA